MGDYYMAIMLNRSEEERETILAEARECDLNHPWPIYEYSPKLHLDTTPEELLSPEILAMPFGDVLNKYSELDGMVQARIKFFFRQKLGILEEHSRQILYGTAGSLKPLALSRADATEGTTTGESEVRGTEQLKDEVKPKVSIKIPAPVLKKRGLFVSSVLRKLHVAEWLQ
ncbi:hypothetical protein GL218_09354 [Daldinia childiae]|uniref:uncharacterized protein n=1 Tax=Daldinia childiae TaxID=326645 RepID=UPI001446A410|nr:uncharacterized protein GL218_09354 [Daldinia childiae]KAF3065835.1 hypothetical protein GL218_09354 [Daldinia childiae]